MDRGYTLLEVVVSMAIFSILLAASGRFISFATEVSSSTKERVMLESHYSHLAIFLEKNIEDKRGISMIRGRVRPEEVYRDMLDERGEIYISSIRFDYGEELKRELDKSEKIDGFGIYISDKNSEPKKVLRYDKDFKNIVGKMECGGHIEEVKAEPLPEGETFRNARGVRLKFKNTVGKKVTVFEKTLYFRNWEEDVERE